MRETALSPQPLVSICIPAYNSADVVEDALCSAMGQTYGPLEIVVIDNSSSDQTTAVVNARAAGDPRVRLVRHAENIGMARNFSACISEAAGELVLILCADDVLEKGCIYELSAAMRDYPDAVLAACSRTFTDEGLNPLRVRRARSSKQAVDGRRLMRECLVWGNRIGEPSAVLFRRAAAGRGFDPEYNQAVDLEMWLHLLENGPAVLLPQALCKIRQHAAQATRANLRSGRVIADKQKLFCRYAPGLDGVLTPVEKLIWDARMASSLIRAAQPGRSGGICRINELYYPRFWRTLLVPTMILKWTLLNALSG